MTLTSEIIEEIKISDITIGERFRKDVGDVSSLAASIQNIGLLHPVVIDETNKLIAGRRRLAAFEYLGKDQIPFYRVNILNALKGEYDENVERKDFTVDEIVAIKKEVEKSRKGHAPSIAEEVREEVNNLLDTKVADSATLSSSTIFEPGPSAVVTGKIAGFSSDTVKKMELIVMAAKIYPDIQKALEEHNNSPEGKPTIDKIYDDVRRKQKREDKKDSPLPQGQFDIILADPPWHYDYEGRGTPTQHYATMTLEDIKKMKLPTGDDAVLFLWSPQTFLKDALAVMESWGFKYVTGAVWVKDKIGMGMYFRLKHELLLLGIKGKGIGTPEAPDRPESVFVAERSSKHSEKPSVVYEILERMYPVDTYKFIELFARDNQSRPGWTFWGDEAK